jgi:ABC-2 type transport system ATP-binding protein
MFPHPKTRCRAGFFVKVAWKFEAGLAFGCMAAQRLQRMTEAGWRMTDSPREEFGMRGPEIVLKALNVSKSYGPVRALSGVDIDVKRGEFVALLGPNGAGKSTLFQILTGLFVPDKGTVVVAGDNLAQRPAAVLSKLGIVFQQHTLDLELTVHANLRLHAALHGLTRAEAKTRIDTELARFELTSSASSPARSLSGGNRRRVELARALLHRPDVLLMDEPTVGLDPASRSELLRHVRELCRERQVGVLWATHLVDEAEKADRIIVMFLGKLLFNGTPRLLLERGNSDDLTSAFLALLPVPPPADERRSEAVVS